MTTDLFRKISEITSQAEHPLMSPAMLLSAPLPMQMIMTSSGPC